MPSELTTSGIIISIIALLVGIIAFLFNFGQKDLLTHLPVFRKESNELVRGILFLGLLMFGIAFTIPFSNPTRFSRILFFIAFIGFMCIAILFLCKNYNLSNKTKKYTTKCKSTYIYIVFYIITLAVAVGSILCLLYLDSPNFETIILHVITFLLLILSSGYFRAMSYIASLKKVDIFYEHEQGKISELNCYWVSEIDGWIVVKHEDGDIYYLKKERIIKMLID